MRERDLAILKAFNARGSVGEIAEAAGMSRTNVYLVLKRLGKG
jgi:DNA-binding IclR family transcriptional regulator